MGDIQELQALLGRHILSGHMTERVAALERLHAFLRSDAATTASPDIFKGIFALLVQTQQVYVDRASRRAALRAVELMLTVQPLLVGRAVARLATMQATQLVKAEHVESSGVVVAFSWATLLLRLQPDHAVAGEALRSHLAAMASLLRVATATAHRCVAIAHKALAAVLRIPGRAELLLDQSLALPSTPDSLVLAANILGYCQKRRLPLSADIASKLMVLVKDGCLAHKQVMTVAEMDACRPVFSCLTHDAMAQDLLPALLRGLKRTPEVVVQQAEQLLARMALDLSRYVGKLVPEVLPFLTENNLYQPAVALLSTIARRSCDLEAHVMLMSSLTEVLTGKKGKGSKPEQRAAVLSILAATTSSTLSPLAKTELSRHAGETLIPYIRKETHEGTLAPALQTLGHFLGWADDLAEVVVGFMAEGLSSNKSKPALLQGFFACLTQAVGDKPAKVFACRPLAPQILDLCNAALKQAQPAWLGVAVMASHLLESLLRQMPGALEGMTVGSRWDKLAASEHLTSLKTLSDAHPRAIVALMSVFGQLLETVPDLAGDRLVPWAQAVSHGLLFPERETRVQAAAQLSRVLQHYARPAVWEAVVSALCSTLGKITGAQDLLYRPSPACCASAVLALAVVPVGGDAAEVACRLVLPCFHPALGSCTVWHKVLLRLQSANVLQDQADQLAAQLRAAAASPIERPAVLRAVRALASDPTVGALRAGMMAHTLTLLHTAVSLDGVTETECGIFFTAEGELYAEDVLKGGDELSRLHPNSKEYKDKVWELQVQKEVAKRKGETQSKLSKKQLEVRSAQLAAESVIRARLRPSFDACSQACELIEAFVEGQAVGMADFVPPLTQALLARATSQLLAPRIAHTWTVLAKALPTQLAGLRTMLAMASLRCYAAAQCVPVQWQAVSLGDMLTKLVRQIWTSTHEHPLDAAGFAYCLPVLSFALRDYGSRLPGAVLEDALVCLHTHAALGACPLLDRAALLALLQYVVTHHERLAHQACVTLHDVAVAMGQASQASAAIPAAVSLAEYAAVFSGIVAPSADLRLYTLRALPHFPFPHQDDRCVASLWVATHDDDQANAAMAMELWSHLGIVLGETVVPLLVELLVECHPLLRVSSAKALGASLQLYPHLVDSTVRHILRLYVQFVVIPAPTRDAFGNIVGQLPQDRVAERVSLMQGLAGCAAVFTPTLVIDVFRFFVTSALFDRNSVVQDAVLAAGQALMDVKGEGQADELMGIFQSFLVKSPRDSGTADVARQSVIAMMGSLAKHLAKDDPRVGPIVETLIDALSTPSQQVQQTVADCLPPLIPAVKERVPQLLEDLMHQLLDDDQFGSRRGAAYGIAAVVKGTGISTLKTYKVVERLQTAIENKKVAKHREGALMAYELLCLAMGRLFEPYIIHILPNLLICFGDGSKDVRSATEDAAQAIMSKLSTHGVKLVLPALLNALDDPAWRTKQGSAELLGAMAFCAPKQLSSCLPMIVPPLSNVLTDSHVKVQEAGREALNRIGSVIKNPEIQRIVPVLLSALNDPIKNTKLCLTTLLETAFVHVIDPPSLALIMPILERALKDRSTDTKKTATLIISRMYSLTNPKDLAPYLPNVVPGVKVALLDPVPEVRAVASKALGAMVKGLGEASFSELVPWLVETLHSTSGSVDRAGAAQGLSEVVLALGTERLVQMMPDFIQGTSSAQGHVREGHFMLFVYLPATLQEQFQPYVSSVVPSILRGLADVEEPVRDTALKAGQCIINNFSETSVELLLPSLERGLSDENWRIRESSVELLGDLLFRLSGLTGKQTTEGGEDDNFGTEEARHAIVEALGQERRDRVMAGLYMSRSDSSLRVRQNALHVWKIVVSHTARTLREILPTLITILLRALASSSEEKRLVGARTLGEMVKKLGERILPEIFPLLQIGLETGDVDTRQGVCVGLSEIMVSSNREHVLQYTDFLLPAVRRALCDPEGQVRSAAAQSFAHLHTALGAQAVDEILPAMLLELEDPERSATVLDGLRQLMRSKSAVVLPFLVPRLTQLPMSAFNARALALLASVAGDCLNDYVTEILSAYMEAVAEQGASGSADTKAVVESVKEFLLTVDEDGAEELVGLLIGELETGSIERRRLVSALLNDFCHRTRLDLSPQAITLMRGLLGSFVDEDKDVVHEAWGALSAVMETVKEDKHLHMRQAIQVLQHLGDKDTDHGQVAGLCLPRGIEPLLPLFLDCLVHGNADSKEMAADGLGLLVRLSSADTLGPFVLKIAGALIRVISDHAAEVKAAILSTICALLSKIPEKLKPMVPQLQPTCVKSLKDAAKPVRARALEALALLIPLQKRVDPLLTDLLATAATSDPALQAAHISALGVVMAGAGSYASGPKKQEVVERLINTYLGHEDDTVRAAAAVTLGQVVEALTDEELASTLHDRLVPGAEQGDAQGWQVQHGYALALASLCHHAAGRVVAVLSVPVLGALSLKLIEHDNVLVLAAGVQLAVVLLLHDAQGFGDRLVAPMLANLMSLESTERTVYTLEALERFGTNTDPALLAQFVPSVVTVARTRTGTRKKAAETALLSMLQIGTNDKVFAACAALVPDRASLEAIKPLLEKRAAMLGRV